MKGATRASKVVAIVVLILAISIMGTAAAGGPPGGGFYSGQTIQNVGVGNANVAVTVYDSTNAANQYTKDWIVGEGASQTFFLSDIPNVPSPFMGSAVVSSDQPVKAIVNVTNRKSGANGVDGGTAAAQYRGTDDVSTGTTLVFPLAKANFRGKTTAFYIQNAGANAATFKADFLLGTSLTDASPVAFSYTSPSLASGQMAVIIPSDAGAGNELIGSLTVTSAEKMAGTVMEYETSTAPAKILQGTSGFTANDFDTRVLFPVVKNRFGSPATRSTGLQIQNVGAADVTVNITYKGALGTCPAGQSYTEAARTLKPKQSTTYLETGIPAGCLASAEATVASGAIAAVVNESFQPCSGCEQRATTYAAFPAKSATTKVVAPVFKEDLGGKRSGLTVQNVGNADATANLVFKTSGGTYTYQNLAIPAGQGVTLLNLSTSAAGSWAGGNVIPDSSLAAVTITANQPIIGVVNEAPLPGTVQDNINYETFNVQP